MVYLTPYVGTQCFWDVTHFIRKYTSPYNTFIVICVTIHWNTHTGPGNCDPSLEHTCPGMGHPSSEHTSFGMFHPSL